MAGVKTNCAVAEPLRAQERLETDLPRDIERWNRAMRGAYMKGRRAYLAGQQLADCPYEDKRKPSGGLSWSRSFITAWVDGFRDMKRICADA